MINEAHRQSDSLCYDVTDEGRIRSLASGARDSGRMPFRTDEWGTSWYVRDRDGERHPVKMIRAPERKDYFVGAHDDVRFGLSYGVSGKTLVITATLENKGTEDFQPMTAGVNLGLDSYQERYPDWHEKLVPNVMRCERTHHWGFAMSPGGQILGWICPEPVASYSINYEPRRHRIYTASVDFINQGPLPTHHPQHLHTVKAGETKAWTVYLMPIASPEAVKSVLSTLGDAPLIEAEHYTISPGEQARISVFGPGIKQMHLKPPHGDPVSLSPTTCIDGRTDYVFMQNAPGLYTVRAVCQNGKVAEGSLFVRLPWRWYLEQAAREGLRIQPTETHHAECIYPFYSYYLAQKHFPDTARDAEAENVFQERFPKHYDAGAGHLRVTSRIQDTATWIGILADRYAATGEVSSLEDASRLANWLVDITQKDDGAYCSGGGVHYTSVIYIAKSVMELLKEIRPLAATSDLWRQRYEKFRVSVDRAVADLNARRDNVDTEGQLTYEDGMISCTMTQLAMYALKTGDERKAKAYTESAEYLFRGHRSLTLSAHPDARVNGSTIRFWETQYTICMMANMYNSPCGWTAWKLYGDYYLYLLTGKELYLREAFNGLGACVQLVDSKTGRLRWGFTPDPFIYTTWAEPADQPGDEQEHKWVTGVRGEEYLDPISDWNRSKPIWREKWGIDNFTHEVFKCMEEIALFNSYVIERADGSFGCYNCSIKPEDEKLTVIPADTTINRIHFNVKANVSINAIFADRVIEDTVDGMQWIGPGGIPEELCPLDI